MVGGREEGRVMGGGSLNRLRHVQTWLASWSHPWSYPPQQGAICKSLISVSNIGKTHPPPPPFRTNSPRHRGPLQPLLTTASPLGCERSYRSPGKDAWAPAGASWAQLSRAGGILPRNLLPRSPQRMGQRGHLHGPSSSPSSTNALCRGLCSPGRQEEAPCEPGLGRGSPFPACWRLCLKSCELRSPPIFDFCWAVAELAAGGGSRARLGALARPPQGREPGPLASAEPPVTSDQQTLVGSSACGVSTARGQRPHSASCTFLP